MSNLRLLTFVVLASLFAGCGGGTLKGGGLDPALYPLNPHDARSGARAVGDWSRVVVGLLATVDSEVAGNLLGPAPCVTVAGDASTGATFTFNNCDFEPNGPRLSGTATLDAPSGGTWRLTFELTVDPESGETFTVGGLATISTSVSGGETIVNATGYANLEAALSTIQVEFTLSFLGNSASYFDGSTPHPIGTVNAEFDDRSETLLELEAVFEAEDAITITVNGSTHTYHLDTGDFE